MRIQRSTYEFLLISIVLGSIVLATAYLGYGAGVLVLLFWLVFILIRLKRTKTRTPADKATTRDSSAD